MPRTFNMWIPCLEVRFLMCHFSFISFWGLNSCDTWYFRKVGISATIIELLQLFLVGKILPLLMAHFHQRRRTRIQIQIRILSPIITLYYAQFFPLVQIRIRIPVWIVSQMVTDFRPRNLSPNPSLLVEMSHETGNRPHRTLKNTFETVPDEIIFHPIKYRLIL